jgi:hypothetical protein
MLSRVRARRRTQHLVYLCGFLRNCDFDRRTEFPGQEDKKTNKWQKYWACAWKTGISVSGSIRAPAKFETEVHLHLVSCDMANLAPSSGEVAPLCSETARTWDFLFSIFLKKKILHEFWKILLRTRTEIIYSMAIMWPRTRVLISSIFLLFQTPFFLDHGGWNQQTKWPIWMWYSVSVLLRLAKQWFYWAFF